MTIKEKYIRHLASIVNDDQHDTGNYIQLFTLMYETRFDAIIELDENRIADAIEMRYSWESSNGYRSPKLKEAISVLEIMVSLACRCEDSIMHDYDYGDRTPVWFWYMVRSLGLEYETDQVIDKAYCIEKLIALVERTYKRNGEGGLFYIPGCKHDLRKVEIWYQLNWYLDTLDD